MSILGVYVFNETRKAWLQADEKSWGPFSGAVEFTSPDLAEDIRVRESGDDVTFTMAALH
jgi:hypothetical protein